DETAKHIIAYIFDAWIRVMSPYTPFFAEEMWERIGGEGFVVNALWPKVEEELYNAEAILAMEYTDRLINDIREIVRVQRRKPRKVTILVVKPNEYNELRKAIEYFELGKPMKDFVREYISKAKDKRIASTKAVQLFKFVSTLPPQLRTLIMKTGIDEKNVIRELSDWIKVQIGAEIETYYYDEVKTYIKDKRKLPLPLKPAIYIEF
ncbi:MAG TPA: leucine--tRNA ligase, partial [Desulfurococcales archaeon]|nr:leucine--tRNA ligase [Desulfurococcales archaeon]